ncbi:MAG: hypothetical protein AB1797_02910 [bacterium]
MSSYVLFSYTFFFEGVRGLREIGYYSIRIGSLNMMSFSVIRERLGEVFEKYQADVLATTIFDAYNDLVKVSDFSELKDIVKELAVAQKRTEARVEELAVAQKKSEERLTRVEVAIEELAVAQKKSEERLTRVEVAIEELAAAQKRTEARVEELAVAQKKSEERLTRVEVAIEELAAAQKRTEARVEELAVAQKRTEARVEELAVAQKKTEIEIQKLTEKVEDLTEGLKETRGELGGLSRSMSYAFENEAYRMLPGLLKTNYGIEMTAKIIRTKIKGKEINLFGRARRNGNDVLIVGEAKLRLEKKKHEKKDVFEELKKKVEAVEKTYKEEIVKILITHYGEPNLIEEARRKGIIVIQSFEW